MHLNRDLIMEVFWWHFWVRRKQTTFGYDYSLQPVPSQTSYSNDVDDVDFISFKT